MSDAKQTAARLHMWGIIALVTGGVFAITAIFVPSMFNSAISNGAQGSSALTASNTDKWAEIPGPYNIGINWNHYMFNCSNIWQVSPIY